MRIVVNAATGKVSEDHSFAAPVVDQAVLRAAERASMSISFAQLLIGLVTEGWITEAEGDAWTNRQLPAAVNDLIAGLPQAQRFAARTRAKLPSVVLRNDPLVVALAAQQGKTPEELDQFFRAYSNV